MSNSKEILTMLHLIRSGLASGLLTKTEVINWADKIIIKDDKPDPFFIELALLSSKSENDVIKYFSDYLNFKYSIIHGRPLLWLLYERYKTKAINLEQTVKILSKLRYETDFTDIERSSIYSIDDSYFLAESNIYGTLVKVELELDQFLSFSKNCSMDTLGV